MNEDVGGGNRMSIATINIEDIIRKRKAEWQVTAKQKRNVDLQRIRDMKSATGIDPLQRFPKEIWEKIFNELRPEDRANVLHVHPMFRDLLEQNRVRDILLPQVAKINTLQEILDNADDLLRLFCVSKSNIESVARHIEEKLKKRINEEEIHSMFPITGTAASFRLRCYAERRMLKRLLANYEARQENPVPAKRFFGRSLSVGFQKEIIGPEEDNDILWIWIEFKSNITSLLQIIGDQIWHFKVFFDDLDFDFCTSFEIYILLQGWIAAMPNLKWLEVGIQGGLQLIHVDFLKDSSILRKCPFPKLTSLERFSIHSPVHPRPNAMDPRIFNVFEVILEANQHLKMLDVAVTNDDDLELLPSHLIQSLPLTRFCAFEYDTYKSTILMCLEIMTVNFNWPLQTIIIALDQTQVYASMDSVIQFLEKFPTLETVKLKELRRINIGDSNTLKYLQLPNLTHLEMGLVYPDIEGNFPFFFSLQFLLQCEKLKSLQWSLKQVNDVMLRRSMKTYENENRGNCIDFRAGLRFMYESNIWDVFPSLDIVKVDVTRGDREPVRVNSNFPTSCVHVYLRRERVEFGGKVKLSQVLRDHFCSRNDLLHNCVMLLN